MRKVKLEIVVEFPDYISNDQSMLNLAVDVLTDGMFTTSNGEPYNDRRILFDECETKVLEKDYDYKEESD